MNSGKALLVIIVLIVLMALAQIVNIIAEYAAKQERKKLGWKPVETVSAEEVKKIKKEAKEEFKKSRGKIIEPDLSVLSVLDFKTITSAKGNSAGIVETAVGKQLDGTFVLFDVEDRNGKYKLNIDSVEVLPNLNLSVWSVFVQDKTVALSLKRGDKVRVRGKIAAAKFNLLTYGTNLSVELEGVKVEKVKFDAE